MSGDVVKENKVTGIIQLHGNSSFRSNYSMKRGESGDKFVWFHLCDERNENEPYFPSFKNAHLLENGPRTYKVIIPASELQRENV
ncbi:hypothetical protein, partial [Mycobacterium tuberculosis]|uniref:hypothetical protein n=1 Tax=Mycobacterium tuberculosis TaxID=1773 RepID=UPI001BE098BD